MSGYPRTANLSKTSYRPYKPLPISEAGKSSRHTPTSPSPEPRVVCSGPGLDRLCKDAQRGKFDLVAAWSIDRLGRSLQDLLTTLALFDACNIDLYLDRQAIDTSMPMGRLVFQVIGAFGEFERSMIRERVKAGMARAVAAGKRIGRPTTDAILLDRARAELTKGTGILKTARLVGLGTGTVQKIKEGNGCPSSGVAGASLGCAIYFFGATSTG